MSAAFVQVKAFAAGSAVASQAGTFDNPTVSGNLIVVCCASFNSASAVLGVSTDGFGNVFTRVPNAFQSFANPSVMDMFYCPNIVGGSSHQITVTTTVNGFIAVSMQELSLPIRSLTSLVNSKSAQGDSTAPASGLVSLVDPAGLLVAMVYTPSAGTNPTAGTGWTIPTGAEVDTSDGETISSEYLLNTASNSYNGTFTIASTVWGAAVAAFRSNDGAEFKLRPLPSRPAPFRPGLAR